MDAKLARIREEVEELNHDEKARLEAEKKKILESVQTEVMWIIYPSNYLLSAWLLVFIMSAISSCFKCFWQPLPNS